MTVFKTFFRIVNKLKPTIILYTALLIIFGAVNMKTSDNNINFVNSKPDILIINQDVNKGLTKNLIDYMKKTCTFLRSEHFVLYICQFQPRSVNSDYQSLFIFYDFSDH